MKNKPKNKFKKGSMLTLVIMLSCLIFTSCTKDMDDASIVESNTSASAKTLYFYGSDAEFNKLQGVEMTHITTEQQLKDITKTASNSYALFVGKKIDVRAGIVDDLRNSGILVTQLEEKTAEPKKLPAQAGLLEEEMSNSKSSSGVEERLNDDSLVFTSYLSIKGDHKILGSVFENMKEAAPRILEWRQEKVKKSKNASASESFTSKARESALNFDYIWNQVGDFSIDTEVFRNNTDGYMLNNGSGSSEYAYMYIFEHKITATPRTHTAPFPHTWTVGNIQVIQQPISSSQVDFSLRQYSPLNSSNGVLDGSSGSDSFGYGIDSGFGVDGPSVGSSLDWSHSTDWSVPACQINTFHNPAQELFKVMYVVDSNGSWNGNSVTAENYTYYANNGYPVTPYFISRFEHPTTYFVSMVSDTNMDRDLYIYMNRDGRMQVWKYHGGYFDYPDYYTYEEFSW